jgi:preprotein translocase subunit SecA
VTLQNYFRLYEKLAGMTGTAETEAAEFGNTYGLSVVPIPTNQPAVRDDKPDLIYKSEEAKFGAIVEDVRDRSDNGQPILLGTASVEKSELLSRELSKAGIPHEVLNAKQHFREAEIVAQAGRKGAVTVATNMAGRGVDVILGGNFEGLATREVLGQGLVAGTPEFDAAYDVAAKKWKSLTQAEGDEVRAAGGLYVLGTERHDSRRIDNQLRGRSGRQGDPGESRFYLSLEDDLLRLFATGAVSWVMDRAMPEDEAIEAKMVSKAIERAQNTVEARNAEIRKDVLKYDEVMNEQRKVIYKRRQQVIEGEDIHDATIELIEERIADAVASHVGSGFHEEWDMNALVLDLQSFYPTEQTVESLSVYTDPEEIGALVIDEAVGKYEKKAENFPGGLDTAKEIERDVMLQILDQRWRDHLSDMDYLRDGIHLRQTAQQDPLNAWQKEGYLMFEHLLDAVDIDYVRYITHVEATAAIEESAGDDGLEGALTNANEIAPGATELPAHGNAPAPTTPKASTAGAPHEKLGRNDPCWCGSKRKFKQCHGRP